MCTVQEQPERSGVHKLWIGTALLESELFQFSVYDVSVYVSTLTPSEFRKHYENEHMKVLYKIRGKHFPVLYIRCYILNDRDSSTLVGSSPATNPAILSGKQEDFLFDIVTIMQFRDEAHF